uniref:RING-type domain-containing protein n=1 Tax=Rhodnius prolixus TaxID=13249 RepID=T1HSP8_RHOPR
MNSEESRLRTFANWPEDAAVDPRRIAKAGFYYMGQGLEVQCFSCGGRIAEWNYGDKVMAKHISLDPRCPFVLNPVNSGNVPLVNASRRHTSNSQDLSNNISRDIRTTVSPYKSEESRMTTFATWPIPNVINPVKLAQSGFYYTQVDDKVQCAFCDGLVGNWEYGDEPDVEHQRHFPACTFVSNRHVPTSGVSVRDTRIEGHRVPTNPKYSTFESRVRTFANWPSTVSQKPEQLAEAGFYFTGNRDKVRCFHCDGGLQLWEKDDVPWLEHAKWFSDCGFVLLTKGQEFIEEAIKTFAPTINKPRQVSSPCTVEKEQGANGPRSAALQVGIEASRVKLAIKFNKEVTGEHFNNADDLIIAALDIQTEENASLDMQESWSTPPMSPAFRSRCINPRSAVTPSTSDDSDDEYEEENSFVLRLTAPSNLFSLSSQKPQTLLRVPNTFLPKTTSSKKVLRNLIRFLTLSLEEENRRLKEARLCKICMDSEVEIVLLPCGHLVTCINCSHSLADCPLCRQAIRATVRTFLS